ncbi:MAG TPA: type I DNA topoisomerase [Acidobacteriaceae bacterium]|jgi:DNA topoisomerase-1|nr:type I DNA topoisomerase [Acidobacteriaceae bacterium]
MAKALVIVESPAKAKTINKYLGKDYTVEATIGHIMDLPKNKIGVDLEDGTFEPELIVMPGKEKVVDRLKKLAGSASAVYLAPDPDREGEAIAWHLQQQLKPELRNKATIQRVTFNEITQKAVKAAFQHAGPVDAHLVDAQQTRRVLDRIVGYQISPLLWDKVRRGLSAGRVQTVAVRLIVERERLIKAFQPVEYWTLDAQLLPAPQNGNQGQEFTARFIGIDGKRAVVETVNAASLPNQAETDAVVNALKTADWKVRAVEKKERRQNPTAPFTTSKLQQDASRKLGFNVKRTMGVAQRLYEGVEVGSQGTVGLITYMRTDSIRVSPDAIQDVRTYIDKRLGAKYLPASPNVFKGKKDAQDAHEAIRPTNVEFAPDEIRRYLSEEQYKLYKLIWQRFVASQMVQALFDQTTVDIVAKADRSYDYRVTGSVLKFDGFLKVYEEAKDAKDADDEALSNRLPELNEGQALKLQDLKPEQHFTEPAPRFNEASLVKELEERGIGRPSTYASIINTIQDREYAVKVPPKGSGKFYPTELGMVVNDLLVKNFPYIFDPAYTAKLEVELDAVEEGTEKWTDLLSGFYGYFQKELKVAGKNMEDIKRMEEPTKEKCPECGSPLVLKWGKFGSFYACSAYDKKKPVNVASSSWEKDPKKAIKKIEEKLVYPMLVKAAGGTGPVPAAATVNNTKELQTVMTASAGPERKLIVEQISCKFTRENFEAKPNLQTPEAQGAEAEEEFCENCGRVMVLRNGPFGQFMACPGYNEDPPCKTIRKLTQKQQQKPAVPLDENCPKCGMQLVLRTGQYGEFVSCSGYPKCKYIKQNLTGVTCPTCGKGDIAERKARRGNIFYGCTNYPKCDFTSNYKPVPQPCPECGSPYLLEKTLKSGVYLVCPNNKKQGAEEEKPKRRKKTVEKETEAPAVICNYELRTGDAPAPEEKQPEPVAV